MRRRGLALDPYLDVLLAVVLAGALGGRLGWAAEHPETFASVRNFFAVDQGGMSFFGGLAFAFPAYIAALRWRGLPVWESSDLLAPILPFSLAVLRFGCLGEGCCYGKPTNLPWGIALPGHPGPVHPSPLYETAFLLALAAVTFALNERRHLRPGLVATLCLGAYGAYRFAFDFLRGDLSPTLPGGLASSQVLALLLVGIAIGVGFARMRNESAK